MNKKTVLPQKYWGAVAIICIIGSSIAWFFVDQQIINMAKKPVQDTDVEEIQVESVTANKNLGFMIKEVPPLELKKRIVAINGDHGKHFRGTKFIQANQNMWTVELFRANEERVVLDYIQHHADEKEIFYTRLSGDDQEELYVVFYGRLKTKEGAQRLSEQLVTLDLPKTLMPTPVAFKDYVRLVNEVGSEEMMSGINHLYEISLKPVALPKPVILPPSDHNSDNKPNTPIDPAPRVVRPRLPELNHPVDIPRE